MHNVKDMKDFASIAVVFVLVFTAMVVLGTAAMFLSWNYGVVPAVSFAKNIDASQAFCLSLFMSWFGLSVKTKKAD